MRLAYLTSQYPAASHTFIRREVEALRDLGREIETFSVRPPGADETEGNADRSEAEKTFYILRQSASAFIAAHLGAIFTGPLNYLRTFALALRHRAPGTRGLLLSFAHFAESVLLARELDRRGVRHLHNHFANSAATVGLLATRMIGIGWSFTMHGISETDYPAGLMLGRKIEAARFVACVSYFGRAQGMRLVAPGHWTKMHVVRCGLPFDRLPPRKSDGNGRTLICVGRLSPEKGQAGLLEAFAEVCGRHQDLKLRLVGNGPDRQALEALAAGLGIADRVTFLGRMTETDTLAEIARSDSLVLPSFMEGLPIVLMEAMALGVPVVASRIAGIPELVEDGTCGLLFTPSRWDELARCMERLLIDKALRDSIAEQGMRKVVEEFDVQQSAKTMAALFDTACGK
jgi:glycosyltransferase involved in cell wall biosynthesis